MNREGSLVFRNSVVHLEEGDAGTILRVERGDGVDYVGPVSEETIDALREVAVG